MILGRCKYIVYDGTLPHLLTNLAFADWATVDLQLILEDPQRCRLYQGLDEQWTLCREGRELSEARVRMKEVVRSLENT